MSNLAWLGLISTAVFVACAWTLIVRWQNDRRGRIKAAVIAEIDDMVKQTRESTDALINSIDEHFSSIEQVLYPKPSAEEFDHIFNTMEHLHLAQLIRDEEQRELWGRLR